MFATPEEPPVKPPEVPPVNDTADEVVFTELPLVKAVGDEAVFMGLPLVRAMADEVVFTELPLVKAVGDETVFVMQLRSFSLSWLSRDVTEEAVITALLLESPTASEIVEALMMLSLLPHQLVGAGSSERNDMPRCSHRRSAVDGFPTRRSEWNAHSNVSTKDSLPEGYPFR